MSAVSSTQQAIQQYRNAMINVSINRGDPFFAIMCAHNMLANMDKKTVNEIKTKMKEKGIEEPEYDMDSDYLRDPDQQEYVRKAWLYLKNLSYFIEESNAAQSINRATRGQFS